MTNSEAPFTATLPLDVHGCRVLLTARGDTQQDLQIRWAELAENAASLVESFNLIIGAATAAPAAQHSPAPMPTPVAPAVPNPWDQPVAAAPSGPSCAHGPRTPVSKVGAKGPWKAWMCNAPQGGPKCDPIWISKQSPEWNTFPA